jgi:DNA repair exonuclease SbcCD nuclease subunit
MASPQLTAARNPLIGHGRAALKFLHFADLHLDTQFQWAGASIGGKRRQALRDTLRRILELAAERGAEAILCAGDLYEQERFSPDTAEFLRAEFDRAHPLKIYVAPGNHDWFGPQSLYHHVKWSPNVHIFGTDRLEPITLTDGLTLWGAAHRAPANTDGFLNGFKVDRGGVHLAVFHGSERGSLVLQGHGKVPHAPFDAEQVARSGIHHAFVGHYHNPQEADAFTYPGNPDPLSFGETGDRGAVIATVDEKGAVIRERYPVAQSQVHDLTVDVTGCSSNQDIRDRIAAGLAGLTGSARVTLDGELSPQIELQLHDLESLAPEVEPVVTRVGAISVGYEFDAIAEEPTVRGQFVKDVRASDLSADAKRRVLTTGLRALSRRKDLEAR